MDINVERTGSVPDYGLGIPSALRNTEIDDLLSMYCCPETEAIAYFDERDERNRLIVISTDASSIDSVIDSFKLNNPHRRGIGRVKRRGGYEEHYNGLVGACYTLTRNLSDIKRLSVPSNMLLIRIKAAISGDKTKIDEIMRRLLRVSYHPGFVGDVKLTWIPTELSDSEINTRIPTASNDSGIIQIVANRYSPETRCVAYFDSNMSVRVVVAVSDNLKELYNAVDLFSERNNVKKSRKKVLYSQLNNLSAVVYNFRNNPERILKHKRLKIPPNTLLVRVIDTIPRMNDNEKLEKAVYRLLLATPPPEVIERINDNGAGSY